jgi:hypothetical protein
MAVQASPEGLETPELLGPPEVLETPELLVPQETPLLG